MKTKDQNGGYLYSDKPTDQIGGYPVRPGFFNMNGATVLQSGVNFSIHTHEGTSCELLFFHSGCADPFAVLPFPDEYKVGDVYSMLVLGLDITDIEYAYRIDGPYDREQGLLFNRENILLDPYARAVTVSHMPGRPDRKVYHARVVRDTFDWGKKAQSKREMSDLIIYELHVGGFTKDPSSGVSCGGTFRGLMEKIPYLKELGINAVELMPVFEFDEHLSPRMIDGHELFDFWGYNSVSFFAPNIEYASLDERHHEGRELKELIRALHENDIEVILDVVFNHTAEGNEDGTVIHYKGLDNRIYYTLDPNGKYYNFSGCGNTLNCNHPVVQRLILDCLRYWTLSYRVDGFRFDLASIMGRNEDGSPMENPPLLRNLASDPFLSNVKLIAEAWDAGGMYQVGSFPASGRWAEWNGRYRDTMRAFLKGDAWEAEHALQCLAGSDDLYAHPRPNKHHNYAGYNSSVNFLTCHDGFTLYDLYSYNQKHNEKNGWDNTDGMDDNKSWNCGAEGETEDPAVIALRRRMIRNACTALMCSRGTPMFLSGDEFGNTKFGNNNSYCQDNKISWLDWNLLDKNRELFDFFKYMIAYRKGHKIIEKSLPPAECGMESVSAYRFPNGSDSRNSACHTVGFCFAGHDESLCRDDAVYILLNTYWEDADITLPVLPEGAHWYLSVYTYGDADGRFCWPKGEETLIESHFFIKSRSVAVFSMRPE